MLPIDPMLFIPFMPPMPPIPAMPPIPNGGGCDICLFMPIPG
jgi:hypothetical protein